MTPRPATIWSAVLAAACMAALPAAPCRAGDTLGFVVGETIHMDGITPVMPGTESEVVAVPIAGRHAIQARTDGAATGGGMIYFRVGEEPDEFLNWKGDRGITVTVTYFDGAKGVVRFAYDSSDFAWRHPPYPAGVWKRLDTAKAGLVLTGTNEWTTVSFELPMPLFRKRLHSYADFRISYSCSPSDGFAIHSISIERDPEDDWGVIE